MPKRLSHTASFALLLTGAVSAQDQPPSAPAPPEEMERFEVWLGNWSGSGIYFPPGGPQLSWTGSVTVKRVLDGHYVQDDIGIRLGSGEGPLLTFRDLYYWDAAAHTHRAFGVGNDGEVWHHRIRWTEDGALVGADSRLTPEGYRTRTWRSSFEDDTWTVLVQASYDGGPFAPLLHGVWERGGEGFDVASCSDSRAEVREPMRSFADESGEWRFEGWMKPMPGMPQLEIAGTERISPLCGGHAQWTHIRGEPVPGTPKVWEGFLLKGWDTAQNRGLALQLGNLGDVTPHTFHLGRDGEVIWHASLVQYGVPTVLRSVSRIEGDTMRVRTTRIVGTGEPEESFSTEGERKKG